MKRDVLALLGLGLVGFGCWLYSAPLACVVVGALLLADLLATEIITRRRQ